MEYGRVLESPPSGEFIEEGSRMAEKFDPRRRSRGSERLRYGSVLRELPSGERVEEGSPMLGGLVAITCSMPIWAALFFALSVFF